MSAPEESVAEFYAPVLADKPAEVQRLVVRLLNREFKQANELEDEIMAAAQSASSEEDDA